MKRNIFFTIFLAVCVIFLASSGTLFAEDGGSSGGTGAGGSSGGTGAGGTSGGGGPIVLPNPLGGDSDFFTLLDRFINVLTIFAAPILVALITVAGFMYMFGGADPNKRTTAVKIMKYGIIGFIVIIFARAVAAIVQGVL